MKGGFKVGGVNGHRVSHGSAMVYLVSHELSKLRFVKGYGVYTSNNPWSSVNFCLGTGLTTYKIIALRALAGRPGTYLSGVPLESDSAGSKQGTLVLKTSEQCLVKVPQK